MGIETALLGANIAGGIAGGKAIGKKLFSGPPPAPDYMAITREQGELAQRLLDQQTQANRPNQNTPFANSQWTQGPDGRWTQSVSLAGPLNEANQRAQLLAAEMMGQPLDYSSLQAMGSGESARQQAIDAAYGQAASRLDPRFSRARDSERTRLLNQGLSEGSEAFRNAMGELGNQENDAYNQAMYGAIGQGTQAGSALFNQNMAARQQGLAEMLQRRTMPMQDLQQLQSLAGMPGFQAAGRAETPNLVGAAGAQDAASMQRFQMQQEQLAQIFSMLKDAGMIGAQFASDERMKENIERLPYEVFPGVPVATWDWRPEHGHPGPTMGVIAQDLRAVAPDLVSERPDGYLVVDYGGLARLGGLL